MNYQDPQVSIIIPVFNAEQYLKRCLDSIVSQNYSLFECILVDDGSTDESSNICDYYSSEDNRFKVIHCDNGGPSRARNRGLDIVRTKWVTFVDADDYVKPDYLENFLKYNRTDDMTQIIQGYHCFGYQGEDIDTLYKGTKYSYKEIISGQYSDYLEINNILYNWAVWCKIFSIKIIRKYNLRFEETLYCGEDGLFWHSYLAHIEKIIFIQEQGYIYFCPRQFESTSRNASSKISKEGCIALAMSYRILAPELIGKFKLRGKYASFLKLLYLNNYYRALIKSRSLDDNDLMILKMIRPAKTYIINSTRGFIYWMINLFPIKFIRKITRYFI